MPRSAIMGWETVGITNDMSQVPGVGQIIRSFGPVGSEGPVHSVYVGLRMGNSAYNSPSQTGRPVALVYGYFAPSTDWQNLPFNPDWGSVTDYNPKNYQIGGSNPQGWGVADAAGMCVFAFTMECQLPEADIYRDQIFMPPNTIIPIGSRFVIRMNMLTIPKNVKIDFESQGVIFYG